MNAIEQFSGVSLSQLNEKAALLERRDKKYVVSNEVLREMLAGLAGRFDILDIDGQRSFTYRTRYFDDASYRSFNFHRQGRRKRFKVRTRHYLDSDACFVEVKLKGPHGSTLKRRMSYMPEQLEMLDETAMAHVEQAYIAQYDIPFSCRLEPALDVVYERITLMARAGRERLTIDRNILFRGGGRCYDLGPQLAIIETKSARGEGEANLVLRRLHQHPVQSCSKYCVGLVATDQVEKFNRFLPALRKMGIKAVL